MQVKKRARWRGHKKEREGDSEGEVERVKEEDEVVWK